MHAGRRIASACALIGWLVAAASSGASAQQGGRISGWVLEDSTRLPIPTAQIALWRDARVAPERIARTNDTGYFSLELAGMGDFELRVQRLGYSPFARRLVVLDTLANVEIRLFMTPVPGRVAEVTVTGQERSASFVLEDFERRRQRGPGTFFTRDQLEARGWPGLMDLLRGLPGVDMEAGRFRGASGVSLNPEQRPCRPVLFIDGARATSVDASQLELRHALESVSGNTMTAVELYRGLSELPPGTEGWQARCGAIFVWTKRPDDELERARRARRARQSPPDSSGQERPFREGF